MTIPTLIGHHFATTTYGNTLSPVVDSGRQAGDLIVVVAVSDSSRLWALPTGYTQLFQQTVLNHLAQGVFYKVSAGNESSVTVNITAGNEPLKCHTFVVRNWDGNTLPYAAGIGLSVTPVAPASESSNDALVLRCMAVEYGSGLSISAKPSTEIETSAVGTGTDDITTSCSQQDQTGAGAIGSASYTVSISDNWIASTIVINGSGGAAQAHISVYDDPFIDGFGSKVIQGTNFEAAQGAGTLTLTDTDNNSHTFTIGTWSDTEIDFTGVNTYATDLKFCTASLTLTPNLNNADTKLVDFSPATSKKYTDIGVVNIDANLRLTSVPDLEHGCQIVYDKFLDDGSTTIYGVTVSADGSFSISGNPPYGTYTFVVRARNILGEWSNEATETVVIGPMQAVNTVFDCVPQIALTASKAERVAFACSARAQASFSVGEIRSVTLSLVGAARFAPASLAEKHNVDVALQTSTDLTISNRERHSTDFSSAAGARATIDTFEEKHNVDIAVVGGARASLSGISFGQHYNIDCSARAVIICTTFSSVDLIFSTAPVGRVLHFK